MQNKSGIYLKGFVALLVVLLIGLLVWRNNVKPVAVAEPEVKPIEGQLYKATIKPLDIPQDAINNLDQPETKSSTLPNKSKTPAYCKVQWQRLISLETKVWLASVESGQGEDWQACIDFVPAGQGTKSMVQAYCQKEHGTMTNQTLCLSSIIMYRSVLVDLSTLKDRNFNQMKLGMLINKFTGRLLQGEDAYKASIADLRTMAQEIIKLEPDNPSSYKFPAIADLLMDEYDKIDGYAKQGLAFNPKDIVLLDLLYLSQGMNDVPALLNTYQSEPQNHLAAYHWAGHLWREGQLDEARTLVARLAKEYPDNTRYKNTAENSARMTSTKERPFDITLPLITENW